MPISAWTLRGQRRANRFDVSFEAVLWLKDHFAGIRIEHHDARECERELTDEQQDHGAVRLHAQNIPADVPHGHRVLASRKVMARLMEFTKTGPVPSPENVRTKMCLHVLCHLNAAFLREEGSSSVSSMSKRSIVGAAADALGATAPATTNRMNANHAMMPRLAMIAPSGNRQCAAVALRWGSFYPRCGNTA
jgi:hypothetical protein